MSKWLSKIAQPAWQEAFFGQLTGYKVSSHYCGAIDQVHKEDPSTPVYMLNNVRGTLQTF